MTPHKNRKPGKPEESDTDDVIRLEDLAPRDDVKGGTGKLRFGESAPRKPSRHRGTP